MITWTEDGTSFKVLKPTEFSEKVLPNFFKTNKFTSFVRQVKIKYTKIFYCEINKNTYSLFNIYLFLHIELYKANSNIYITFIYKDLFIFIYTFLIYIKL